MIKKYKHSTRSEKPVNFPIALATTRKQLATAGYLNRVAETIAVASANELRYIWSQLKATDYVWDVVRSAGQDPTTAKNRAILRTTAFFWSAGIRPTKGKIPAEVQESLEQTAFLLLAHRELLKQQLPTDVDRLWLFDYRRSTITSCLMERAEFASSAFFDEGRQYLWDADSIIYCAGEEKNFARVNKLVEYLNRFCLLPEDVGISPEQLASWLHQRLVDQAWVMKTACLPFEWKGEIQLPPMLDVYANIYGVLMPLTQGVEFSEIELTPSDLLKIKARLEDWLPKAMANPDHYGVSAKRFASFMEQVMPMFDEVLKDQGLHLVR